MGFFSDLKADLSQAVNELVPEESSPAGLPKEEDIPDLPEPDSLDDYPLPRREKVIFHKVPESMEHATTDWKAIVTESIQEREPAGITTICKGTVITGDITCEKELKVEEGAVLMGNLSAASAVIAGAVKGDIDVRGSVILNPTAVVVGNIRSRSVRIDTGAVIEGMCSQCYADVKPTTIFDEIQRDGRKE